MGDKEEKGGGQKSQKIYVIYGRTPKFIPIFFLANFRTFKSFIDIEKQIDWKGMEKSLIFLHICKKCGT